MIASLLLLLVGLFGAFDVLYFHHLRARVPYAAEKRREAWAHVAKAPVYAALFLVVPNLQLSGASLSILGLLVALDVGIAAWDVAVESEARRAEGGLPAGEYALHLLITLLVGALFVELARDAAPRLDDPSAVALRADVPEALRLALGALAAGCLFVGAIELAAVTGGLLTIERWADARAKRPVHVSVDLETTVEALWAVTQDHVRHPEWDHRFSHIEMLADSRGIRAGTEMLYEKRLLGLTVRGFGRYKHHRPLRQSTFEFWSDDPKSLIRRGVGLWRYQPLGAGRVRFSTSYTYEPRWGLFGKVVDALVGRPWFQRETERSFARLAREHLGQEVEVRGATGRKPAPARDDADRRASPPTLVPVE
jgi:hypothetical protein